MDELINDMFDGGLIAALSRAVIYVFPDSQMFNSFTLEIDVSLYDTASINAPYDVALPQYLLALKRKGELNKFVKAFNNKLSEDQIEEDNTVSSYLEVFKSNFTRNDEGKIIGLNNNHFQSMLFNHTNLPFLDRTDFRKKFYNAMHGHKGEVIFVKGEKESGMSYLKEYLLDICAKFDFLEFKEINAHKQMERPAALNGQGLYLAKVMAAKFSLDIIDLNIEDIEDLKFIRFSELLKAKCSEMDKIPLVFIHDFHKVTNLLSDVSSFLYELLKSVVESFPRAIFVVAGFPYENLSEWDSDLSNRCEVYEMEKIGEGDLKKFANVVYNKYEGQIKSMYGDKHDKFKEDFVQRLLPLSQNKVSDLAKAIKQDLKKIETYV